MDRWIEGCVRDFAMAQVWQCFRLGLGVVVCHVVVYFGAQPMEDAGVLASAGSDAEASSWELREVPAGVLLVLGRRTVQ